MLFVPPLQHFCGKKKVTLSPFVTVPDSSLSFAHCICRPLDLDQPSGSTTSHTLNKMTSAIDHPQQQKSQVALEFEPLFAELEAERSLSDSIREKSKELDRCYRSLSSLLNSVHSTKGDQLDGLIEATRPIWTDVRGKVRELGEMVPEGGYYRVRRHLGARAANLGCKC